MKVGEGKIQFRQAPAGTEWAVFITRTTTQVVEVRVPDRDLKYTHDPDSLKPLEKALLARATEKNLRGETLPVVGPVFETETTTWEMVGPRADEARSGLTSLYTRTDDDTEPDAT